jgi:hypothetical protein
VQNRAIGGFTSVALARTTEQDIAAFYPDLIIFHVYGDHHAYEKIIRLFRSRTAADILVQTDHGEVMPDPPCADGIHLALHRPPGCVGFIWYHQRLWSDEMSYHKIPSFAKKYQLAVEPVRSWWRDYLLRTGTKPPDLLQDEIHPNERGKQLMAEMFNRYFDNLVAHYNGEQANDVAEWRPDPVQTKEGTLHLSFEGSRLELISFQPLSSWPSISIDGQSPKILDGCYLVSRTSPLRSVSDWPALRRITLLHDHTPEQWTATLSNFSSDQKDFTFTVQGTISGAQRSGRASQDFVTHSGLLKFDSQDWMIERGYDLNLSMHGQFEVRWSVDYLCGGQPEVTDRGDGTTEYRYLIAAGLLNGPHNATLTTDARNAATIDHLITYKPRLAEN